MRPLLWFLPCYALTLLVLAPRLSLWLDEILTLIGAIEPNTFALLEYIKTVPGGTPLAFLPPRWSIQALGNSPLSARLPSILASIAACPAIFLLARRMKLRTPFLAVLVFALWPLQLRYALEARPYALALALSVWSTEIFLSLRQRPTRLWLYVSLTALAALAQPYAIFVALAHFAWALQYDRPTGRAPAIGLAVATIGLIPWYSYFRADWSAVVAEQRLAAFDPKSVLVLLHEVSGSGYPGTAILLAGISLTFRRPRPFWLLGIAIPIIAVFIANLALHYFFATRQLVFILPALALLFTLGGSRLLLIAFLVASLYEDVQWFRKPRENWQAAANAIEREVAQGACVTFLGENSDRIYEFFQPSLAAHTCSGTQRRIVIATSPYVESRDYAPPGLRLISRESFNGPGVEVYAK
jgi:hypothetical protein